MSSNELNTLRHQMELHAIRIEHQMTRNALDTRTELTNEILRLRSEIAELKRELRLALHVRS